jgi:peptidoglycan/xylan/chitin deacetylase (PgdA/CDA1 family)
VFLGGIGLGFADPFAGNPRHPASGPEASAAVDNGGFPNVPAPASPDRSSTPPPDASGPIGDYAPVVDRISTADKVVFIGIDDGWVRDPGLRELIVSRHLPVSLFLTTTAATGDLPYFRDLVAAGATVEDHTISHTNLTKLSPEAQRAQICGAADALATDFGKRPTVFRPPFGAHNAATQRMAAACGRRAIIQWDVTVNDGVLRYAYGTSLQPGDIVLMHFRQTGVEDMTALLDAISAAGLRVGRLESYLGLIPRLTGAPPTDPPTHPALSRTPTSRPSPSTGPTASRTPKPSPTHKPTAPPSVSPSPVPSGSPAPTPT